jgi:hypothetical protein
MSQLSCGTGEVVALEELQLIWTYCECEYSVGVFPHCVVYRYSGTLPVRHSLSGNMAVLLRNVTYWAEVKQHIDIVASLFSQQM